MSHLRAEKHIDKRGVAVTRHVRAQGPIRAGRAPIPAPVVVDPAQGKQMTRDSLQRLRDSGLPLRNSNYVTKNLYHLANTDPDLLERVVSHIKQADSGEKAVWDRVLTTTSRHPVAKTDRIDVASTYEEEMAVLPIASQVSDYKSEGYAARVLDGIEMCRKSMEESAVGIEPKVLSAAVIAMSLDRALNDGYGYKFDYTKYADDIAHIADHPSEVAPIIDELVQRQTLDAGIIESILSVSTSSLRDGAL